MTYYNKELKNIENEPRGEIIKIIKTPLQFFTLALLSAESLLIFLASQGSSSDKTIIIIVMCLTFILLIGSVILLVLLERSKDTLHDIVSGLEMVSNNIDELRASSIKLNEVLKQLFPNTPSGVEDNEWNIVENLLHNQLRITTDLSKEIPKLQENIRVLQKRDSE